MIIYGAAFVAVFAYFAFRVKKADPRFDGFRLSSKGGMLFFIGWTICAIADKYENLTSIKSFGYIIILVGFVIGVIGSIKHTKIVLRPGMRDLRREVDPHYDIPYTECPHCHKVEVRVTGSKAKCPKCGGVIKADERNNA